MSPARPPMNTMAMPDTRLTPARRTVAMRDTGLTPVRRATDHPATWDTPLIPVLRATNIRAIRPILPRPVPVLENLRYFYPVDRASEDGPPGVEASIEPSGSSFGDFNDRIGRTHNGR
jgi:hypothetical protein